MSKVLQVTQGVSPCNYTSKHQSQTAITVNDSDIQIQRFSING